MLANTMTNTMTNTMANIETYERMKSSELLRHCVDTYLTETWLHPLGDQREAERTNALCFTLLHYLDDMKRTQVSREDYADLKVQVKRISNRIEDHLVQVTTMHATIAGWLRKECEEHYSEEDIQNIRFMCAEFIALELEDQGD